MTRTLIVMRHGQAAADAASGDHGRALTAQGRLVVREVGRALDVAGHRPALVLCSGAARARQSWEEVSAALSADRVQHVDGLYGASVDGVLDLLAEVDDTVGSVMLVGHNPTLSELVSYLGPPSTGSSPLSAGATVVLESETASWAACRPDAWRVVARFGGR